MKKTNRTFKRFAAITSASLLAACMVAPMAGGFTSSAASITITGITENVSHKFEVYQIFTGDLSEGILSNIKWGTGITSYGSTDAETGKDVPDSIISEITTTNNALTTLGKIVLSETKTVAESDSDSLTINNLADGYYVIKDVSNLNEADDANSAYIIQVTGAVQIPIKKASPSVKKEVQDEVADKDKNADTDGWGATADHAINEKFDFKLTATIPDDSDFTYYENYKLVFNDTLSTGVTFDNIKSVKVNGTEIALGDSGYVTDVVSTSKSFTITINNLIPILTVQNDVLGNDTIEVIYTAHLDASATVHNISGTLSDTNKNTVFLEYSNNPDNTAGGEGNDDMGKTTPDSAWVFTYQVNNTKYFDEVKEGNKLSGAGFTLYNGATPIKLIYNGDGTYTVADQSATVTERNEGEASVAGDIVTQMISNTNGIFNIKGLDIGTYTLKETKTPAGYNTCADKTIKITATHEENSTGATMTIDGENSTMDVEITNKKGNILPGTGGIGTTIFYLGGGAMAAIGGIYLISKRRMKKSEE